MKKFLTLLGLAAIVAVSCAEKEFEYPTPEKGVSYVFEGTVATDGFTWNSASQIGIYGLTDGLKIMNELAQIEGYAVSIPYVDEETGETIYPEITPSEYEGKAVAPFNSAALDLLKGENEFLVYAPYDEEMSYIPSLGVIYNLSVSKAQTQTVPNVAGACFALGKVKGIPGVDEKFTFSLNPVTALLKVTVASSEFVGYGLKKVTIIDEEGTAKLGGTFDVNVDDLSFEEAATFSEISTTITAPKDLAEGEKQSIYINLLPGDFSKELMLIVELQGTKGNVVIPMKKSLGVLEAGKTTELNLTDLKSSDNIYDWFCPVENRMLAGSGYAYGDANTYLIQSKSSVYNGASLTPDPTIPEEVVIDYRVRGDFTKAEIPEGVTFEWAKLANGNVYYTRNDGKFKVDGYTFEVNATNYTVKVKNIDAQAGAPILIMKKGDKILWGWAFWNIAADGTKLEAVNVGGVDMANMNIGQATTQYAAWKAAADHIVRTNYTYQWGRYLPIFWTSYWSHCLIDAPAIQKGGNVPAVQGPFETFRESLDYPYGSVGAMTLTGGMNNWTNEFIGDLWGCQIGQMEGAGTKSIYDPCPKGWRVPDYSTIKAWEATLGTTTPSAANYAGTSSGINAEGQMGLMVGSMYLPTVGYIQYDKAYRLPATVEGGSGSELRYTNNANTGTAWGATFSVYWSNYCASHSASSPFVYRFYGANNLSADKEAKVTQHVRAASASVRCQKDTFNR